jgi:hypothetical protein
LPKTFSTPPIIAENVLVVKGGSDILSQVWWRFLTQPSGDPGVQVSVRHHGEAGELAIAFNAMAEERALIESRPR